MQHAKKLATIEDLLALPDDERAELVEGEIVRRSVPSADHGFSAVKISQSLAPFDRKGGGGGGQPGGWWIGAEVLVVYEGRPNGFVHDLAGWRRDRHPERPKGRRVAEKPDWVSEILSGNRSSDLVRRD